MSVAGVWPVRGRGWKDEGSGDDDNHSNKIRSYQPQEQILKQKIVSPAQQECIKMLPLSSALLTAAPEKFQGRKQGE